MSEGVGVIDTGRREENQAGWLDQAKARIESFEWLAPGWDGENAQPPNAPARFQAVQALSTLHNLAFAPDAIAPSVEDGVSFAWSRGDRYANIEFFNTGEIVTVYFDRTMPPLVQATLPVDVPQALEDLHRRIHG